VGLCVDTAHLYSCGFCLDSKQAAKQWLSGLPDIEINPIMFHLNDSASELGSGRDRHAGLCQGNIWGGYENNIVDSGLLEILTWCEDNNAPVILERDPINLNKDLKLLEGLGFN
jgi:endonuclease IV